MNAALLHTGLSWLQVGTGLIIMLGALALLAYGIDSSTRRLVRWAITGLVCWGAWFGLCPLQGHGHDSAPALALAGLVGYVLIRYGRQVRGILAGEEWWPPNAKPSHGSEIVLVSPRRQPPPWYRKLNPIWLILGNEDDGYWGDDHWRAGRPKTLRLALIWWMRNPCHNLTWYGIGVADRERLMTGRWAPCVHKPGGGLLVSCTWVALAGWWLPLPFISYIGLHAKTYAGWRPSGAFGLELNLSLRGHIEVKE